MTGLIAALALTLSVASFPPDEGPPPPDLSRGDRGERVVELQDALADLGFRPGSDERFGTTTRHAVIAFQKHHGLERDGIFRGEYWDLLDRRPTVRWRAEADRIEVDLGRQVLYLVQDNQVAAVLPVSSGNGRRFVGEFGPTRADTPEGKFTFLWEIDEIREAPLGTMYRPYYFKRGGYAIHGSNSVPTYPASHGCIRVTNRDMDFLRQHISLGMTVYVYGDRTPVPAIEVPSRVPATSTL